MNIIFLTLLDFSSYREHNIYCDLLREFINNGHEVYCISPAEKKTGIQTHFEENGHLLKLRIGNIQKTNIIEKGVSTIMIELQFVSAIKKYFGNVKFNLVLYSTPPITLANAVNYIKSRDGAKTYLMLKDIFPQNAVDLGMMHTNGLAGMVYKYFRNKEKKLYKISDYIGCMSQANVDYVLTHNPEIPVERMNICPNSIEIQDMRLTVHERENIRDRYDIPQDKKVFVYGGNLGKPQGIPFVIQCLSSQAENKDVYFIIVGDGTEYGKMETYFRETHPKNMRLMKRLPKNDFDRMIAACDVGMIFLDHQFTIPNFPSRLLAYMQAGLPVLACTDTNSDIGKVITEGYFGWWCVSTDSQEFSNCINKIMNANTKIYGDNSYKYLKSYYSVSVVYKEMESFIK